MVVRGLLHAGNFPGICRETCVKVYARPNTETDGKKVASHNYCVCPSSHVSCWDLRYCKELRNRAEEVVTEALKLYSTKGLKNAVRYLVASNFISDTPR